MDRNRSGVVRPLDIPVQQYPPGMERFTGPRYQAVAYVSRAVRRGEVSVVDGPVVCPDGTAVYVLRRHRAPAPAWRKPALIGAGIASGVALLGWLVRLAVLAVEGAVRQSATPLALFMACGVLVLIGAGIRRRLTRPREVVGTFRATIR